MRQNFFFNEKLKWYRFLLNDGIYAPSKLRFIANLMLFDK